MNSLSELRTRPAVEPDISTAREIRHCVNDVPSDLDPPSLAICTAWATLFSSCGEYGGECIPPRGDGGTSTHAARGARRGDLGVLIPNPSWGTWPELGYWKPCVL